MYHVSRLIAFGCGSFMVSCCVTLAKICQGRKSICCVGLLTDIVDLCMNSFTPPFLNDPLLIMATESNHEDTFSTQVHS